MDRIVPPPDITPFDFFTCFVPGAVARDESRRRKLGETQAAIVFDLEGEGGGQFTVWVADGAVSGEAGSVEAPDLRVELDIGTWRQLNAGQISAPEALLRRRLKLEGDFLLGLKLHVILG